MRIAFFNWRDTYNPRSGGAEVFTRRILIQLARDGHSVTLFTSRSPGRPDREKIDGVEYVRFGGRFTIYLNAFSCYRREVQGKFDVIVESINGVPFFTRLYAREPVVAFIHQLTRENWYSGLPFPIAFIGYHLEDAMLIPYRSGLALAPSESTRQDLRRLGFRDVSVIYEAPDIEARKGAGKSRQKTVAYLGRLTRSKQVDHVLAAFSKIRESIPDARLVIAGSGPEARNLERMAEKLGIAASTRFAGKVSEAEKAEILGAAHVVLFPAVREGWGLVVLEANACGTPAIGYDVPGLRDSIVDGVNGYLVPADSVSALSERAISLLRDEQALRSLSLSAERHSKGFTWEKAARSMAAALEGAS